MRRRFRTRRRSGGRKWFFILLVLAALGAGAWFYTRGNSGEREAPPVAERSRGSSTLRTVELPPPQIVSNSAGTAPNTASARAEKRGDGELRQTREPVLRRLPVLEPAKSLQWSSGGFGDPAAPGPSLYWLDVLVEMDDSLSAKARALNDLSDAALPEDLHPVVAARLPAGNWQGSPALDRMFSDGPWKTRAWLSKTGPHLLLMVEGQ